MTIRLDDFSRIKILTAVEATLHKAGVVGTLPTPLDRVSKALGVYDIIDMEQLPAQLAAQKPRTWNRILGAIQFSTRAIFVDGSLPPARARFTLAHENGHRILEWHQDAFYLDNDEQLFHQTLEQIEEEANLAAAYQLFQGRHFFDHALARTLSIETAIELADLFGASVHATLRHYVQHHPEPVALIIAGRISRANGHVPVFSTFQSSTFETRFGNGERLVPQRTLPVDDAQRLPELAGVLRRARAWRTSFETEIVLSDRNGDSHGATAEAFDNGRCLFLLVAPRTRPRASTAAQS